jgi:hypothetical protein
MPIWLRNFTYKSIVDYYDKEAEAREKAEGSISEYNSNRKAPNIPKEAFQKKPDMVVRRPTSK